MIICSQLRNLGIYLYPQVPDTTSVTQETNQGHGKFKNGTQKSGKLKCQSLGWRENLFTSIHHWDLFGGKDPETGIYHYLDAFGAAFNKEKNVKCWEVVGEVLPTWVCLMSTKVCWELGDASPDN